MKITFTALQKYIHNFKIDTVLDGSNTKGKLKNTAIMVFNYIVIQTTFKI